MTTQRDASGQNTFKPAVANVTPDLFQLASPGQQQGGQAPPQPPRITVQKMDKDGDLVYWKVTLYDPTGGLGRLRGLFNETHDRVASSTLDTRYEQHLTLPFLTTTATTPASGQDANSNWQGGVEVFSSYIIATGSGASGGGGTGPILFKETSATNPAIASITYTPGVDMYPISAQAIVVGGVANAPRLAVGFYGQNVKVFSDATGTLAGTMHNNTARCSGIIQTPLSDSLMLIYSNGSLYTLAASAAITDAPTAALTNVPTGGWAMTGPKGNGGLLSLGGGPIRAWWVWPTSNNTTVFQGGLFTVGAGGRFRIISTNLQGTDPQELQFPQLRTIAAADIWNDGIFATDGNRAMFHNGRFVKDLRWNINPDFTSGYTRYIAGFWLRGTELYVQVLEDRGSTDARWVEWYDRVRDCWHQVSTTETLTETDTNFTTSGHSMPASPITGFLHSYFPNITNAVGWKRQFQPQSYDNPYRYRKTSTGASGSGQEYESTGTATLPAFQIPGLENWPLVVRRISGSPDVDTGGTGATVQVNIAGTSFASGNSPAIFKTGYQTGVNYGRGYQMFSSQDNSVVFELVVSIMATRQSGGTDPTRFTPQCFPIVIEGVAQRPPGAVFQGFSAPDNRG